MGSLENLSKGHSKEKRASLVSNFIGSMDEQMFIENISKDLNGQSLNSKLPDTSNSQQDSESVPKPCEAAKKTSTATSSHHDGNDGFQTERVDKLPDITHAVQRTGGNIPASLFEEEEKHQRMIVNTLGGHNLLPLRCSPMYLDGPQTEEQKNRRKGI